MALLDIYNFERELAFKEELEQEWQEQEAEYYASLDEVSSFILDKTLNLKKKAVTFIFIPKHFQTIFLSKSYGSTMQ